MKDKMKSVLLTNPIVPYEPVWGEDYNDLTGSRLTRGQGPFTLKSHGHCWALYLIAEKLDLSRHGAGKPYYRGVRSGAWQRI